MKPKWLPIILVVILSVVPLVGCVGVSQSKYEALQAKHEALQAERASLVAENTSVKGQLEEVQSDLTSVQADYEAANQELTEIKEVYPPRDFSSLRELQDWLLANDVSKRPITAIAEDWYGRALEVQEDALKDGYLVSVDYDYDEGIDSYFIYCITIINGRIFYWDPETDDVYEEYGLGTVK